MAESLGFGRSIDRGSDQVLDHFCDPCYKVDENIKPVAGFCQNCSENLCMKCYNGHLRRKVFQDHKLVDKSTRPKTKSSPQIKPQNLGEECLLHHGETVQSFCHDHFQLCCKVCLTIDHQACQTEKISKLARNVQGSQELQNLIAKLNVLKKGFNDNLSKTGANEIVIQKNHRNAINEMKKLQDQFDKLMTFMRPTYLKDITISSSNTNLYGSLVLPNNQMLVTDYRNMKLKLVDTNQDKIISEIQVLGQPLDITKVKDNVVAVTLPDTLKSKIQFVSTSQSSLSKGREISVNGWCNGIAYYTRDKTFIVASGSNPGKIQILNMSGSVIRCLDKDSKGDNLFAVPQYVALNPDMTEMYVTDYHKHTVTLMTMNGYVKAVYQDKSLKNAIGICITQASLVYVVGKGSKTVHQLDPVKGTFKLLLDQKDGLHYPVSISYSDKEDKMYIGMEISGILKVFQMK